MNTIAPKNKAVVKTPAGITIKQTVRFGKPCVKNTRVAVTDILKLIQNGYSLADIPRQYPGITAAKTRQALRYAANVLGKEEVLEISG